MKTIEIIKTVIGTILCMCPIIWLLIKQTERNTIIKISKKDEDA